jgi:hypothetical protein
VTFADLRRLLELVLDGESETERLSRALVAEVLAATAERRPVEIRA